MHDKSVYIIASSRPWNAELAHRLSEQLNARFVGISNSSELTPDRIAELQPRFVFFPHWSARIPDEVWSTHECVIFHMTDVPYGRGGSPLQNLIVRGHDATVITALRCVRELDAGPVYLKQPLSLHGSAEEIFLRADKVIERMIVAIASAEMVPVPQQGEPVMFSRRKPSDGDLHQAKSLDDWYDYIRMLDADGYPPAYLEVGDVRLEFRRVSKRASGLVADVVIRQRSAQEKVK